MWNYKLERIASVSIQWPYFHNKICVQSLYHHIPRMTGIWITILWTATSVKYKSQTENKCIVVVLAHCTPLQVIYCFGLAIHYAPKVWLLHGGTSYIQVRNCSGGLVWVKMWTALSHTVFVLQFNWRDCAELCGKHLGRPGHRGKCWGSIWCGGLLWNDGSIFPRILSNTPFSCMSVDVWTGGHT